MKTAPLFTEGAAKAHFSWHFLSGGNAFDIFSPANFKQAIDRFPMEEAPRMRQDFTRLNFGWWAYYMPGTEEGDRIGTQPDLFEYGTSRAAAWDCPITLQMNMEVFKGNPRTDDNLEVLRRWEDVRQKQWLTVEQKQMLREPGREHILLRNEEDAYELVPYEQIACKDENVRAFVFERKHMNYVVFWHVFGSGTLVLDINASSISLEKEIGGQKIPFESVIDGIYVPIAGRCYLKSSLGTKELVEAFENAKVL